MGKLSDEQAKALKELEALRDAPDEDDFDIEIFDGDKGARVPYSKGRDWLKSTFGIGLDPDPERETSEGGADESGKDTGTVKAFGRTIRKSS